jgi:hypothetical protein
MATVIIEWEKNNEPVWGARDPMFYRMYGHDLVGTVVLDGEPYAQMFCDGEMRLVSPEHEVTIRDCWDLAAHGFLSDDQLAEALEKNNWHLYSNPWFDFYSMDGEHLDLICDDLDHAIATAVGFADGLDTEE